jgi:hypothetical protein
VRTGIWRIIFAPKREEEAGGWRSLDTLHHIFSVSPSLKAYWGVEV